MFVERSENDKIFTALRSIGYHRYCQVVDGKVYLRYDTDDKDPKEQWSFYCDIADELRERNLMIEDPELEHDCISGNVIFIEDDYVE